MTKTCPVCLICNSMGQSGLHRKGSKRDATAYLVGLVTGAFWGEAGGFAATTSGRGFCAEHRALLAQVVADLRAPMLMARMMARKPAGDA